MWLNIQIFESSPLDSAGNVETQDPRLHRQSEWMTSMETAAPIISRENDPDQGIDHNAASMLRRIEA